MLTLFSSFCKARRENQATVKYPLFYEVKRNGKSHFLLGTQHGLPLSAYPEYIQKALGSSKVLLSECLTSLTGEQLKDYGLLNQKGSLLLDALGSQRESFLKDIQGVFDSIGLQAKPEEVSPYVLFDLFQSQVGELVDAEIFRQFNGADNSRVISLNDIEFYLNNWKNRLATQSEEAFADTVAQRIKKEYKNKTQWQSHIYNSLESFICEDPQRTGLKGVPQAFVNQYLTPLNQKWFPRFERNHEKHHSMTMVCGSLHLMGEDGFLARLEQKGFVVQRIQNSLIETAISQLTKLSLSDDPDSAQDKLQPSP